MSNFDNNEYDDRKFMEADKMRMRQQLADAICTVVFTKADGDIRTMKCTTNTRWVPEDKLPKSDKGQDSMSDLFVVFDTEADGWRSFNYPTIKSFSYPGSMKANRVFP